MILDIRNANNMCEGFDMEAWRKELYLAHASGREWKDHKYLYKEGNRYIYPEDVAAAKRANNPIRSAVTNTITKNVTRGSLHGLGTGALNTYRSKVNRKPTVSDASDAARAAHVYKRDGLAGLRKAAINDYANSEKGPKDTWYNRKGPSNSLEHIPYGADRTRINAMKEDPRYSDNRKSMEGDPRYKDRRGTGSDPRYKDQRGTGSDPRYKDQRGAMTGDSRYQDKRGTGSDPRYKDMRKNAMSGDSRYKDQRGTGSDPRYKDMRKNAMTGDSRYQDQRGTGSDPRYKKTTAKNKLIDKKKSEANDLERRAEILRKNAPKMKEGGEEALRKANKMRNDAAQIRSEIDVLNNPNSKTAKYLRDVYRSRRESAVERNKFKRAEQKRDEQMRKAYIEATKTGLEQKTKSGVTEGSKESLRAIREREARRRKDSIHRAMVRKRSQRV